MHFTTQNIIIKVHTKNKKEKNTNVRGQTKVGRYCNAYKSHKIGLAVRVVFQHSFRNLIGRCFAYLLWEISLQPWT